MKIKTLTISFILFLASSMLIAHSSQASKGFSYVPYKSPVIWCATEGESSPRVFKMQLVGKINSTSVAVKRIRYRLYPRDLSRNENNLVIYRSSGRDTITYIEKGDLRRTSSWLSIRPDSTMTIPRGEALIFAVHFDFSGIDPYCSGRFAL